MTSADATPSPRDRPERAAVLRWAHQGGAREAPSNTIFAMERALHGGGRANALELDVHRSRDGVVVVIHDRTLERTTDGHGAVRRHRFEHLAQRDAAWWWVPGEVVDHEAPEGAYVLRGRAAVDPTLRLPSLDAVLAAFPDVPLTVEVKSWRAAAPLVDRLAALDRGDVTITSFLDPVVWVVRWRMRRAAPWRAGLAPGTLATGWFWLRVALRLPPRSSRYARIQIPLRAAGVRLATRRFVGAAHAAGVAVDVWTVDDPAVMEQLLDLGVDGIMTDVPSVLAAVVDG